MGGWGWGGVWGGCLLEEQDKQRQGCDADSSACLLHLVDSLVIWSHPPLPGTSQETPIQMEISYINVNVPYKK